MGDFGWLETLDKHSQRVGLIKILLACAPSAGRAMSAPVLATNYRKFLNRQINLDDIDKDGFITHLKKRGLTKKYPSITDSESSVAVERSMNRARNRQPTVEIQDVLLADPKLVSNTGGETDSSWGRMASITSDLGLIFANNRQLTDDGKFALSIADCDMHSGLEVLREKNPLILNSLEKIFYLFNYCRQDYAVLKPLMALINTKFKSESEFRYDGFSSIELVTLVESLDKHVRSYNQRLTRSSLEKITALRDKFERWGSETKGVARETLRRPIEDFLLPRLELLTDMGVLKKGNKYSYQYSQGHHWQSLLGFMSQQGAIEQMFTSGFFGYFAPGFGKDADDVMNPESILVAIRPYYEKTANRGGYAPEEVLTIAAMTCLVDGSSKYFEIETANSVIDDAGARFIPGRNNRRAAFKLP